MKNIQLLLVALATLTFSACKKDHCNKACQQQQRDASPNFDFTKGWKMVQSITSDFEYGNGLRCYGFDFGGTNNNLRCFYSQQWASQQGLIDIFTRLDEFDVNQQRVAAGFHDLSNDYEGSSSLYEGVGDYFLLFRNGKTTVLNQGTGGTGRTWFVLENNASFVSHEVYGHFSEDIGDFDWADERAIHFRKQYISTNRLDFTYKLYYNTNWEYFSGYRSMSNAAMVGAEKINGRGYIFIAQNQGTDSTKLIVLRHDSLDVFSTYMEQNIPFGNFDAGSNYGSQQPYLSNGTAPVLIFDKGAAGFSAYQVDLVAHTVSHRGTSPFAATNNSHLVHRQAMVVCNNEIYFAHVVNSSPAVSKLTPNEPVYVGQPGLCKHNYAIDLEVKNNTLYAVLYNLGVQYEQIYIVTPE